LPVFGLLSLANSHLITSDGNHTVAQFVEALHYKPEGHGFSSRWGYWNFSLTLSSRPSLWPWDWLNL